MYRFIDLHCDTITRCFEEEKEFYQNDIHIDIKRLENFNKPIQVFAIWLLDKYKEDAFNSAKNMLDFFDNEIYKNREYIQKLDKMDMLEDNKIGALLSLEGLESIEDNLDNIDYFYSRGVRIMGLCWNYENLLGYGALEDSSLGLKPFGKDAVKKIEEKNIIIDISHLNEGGFWDLCNITKKPFIASHSNAYDICRHKRNLKKEQLKAIRDLKGIVGINFYPKFLSEKENANIDDLLKHIDYMGNILGEDSICFGSDFDGIDAMPLGISNILDYNKIIDSIKQHFGDNIARKISFENAEKFLKQYL